MADGMSDFRYPIGEYQSEMELTADRQRQLLSELSDISKAVRSAASDLSPEQLDTAYRPGGWTIRQVVHHLADNNMHWYFRTKLALTEDTPSITSYDEKRWSCLHDARVGPIEPSLMLLDALHARWLVLFESFGPDEWRRQFLHPERGVLTVKATLPRLVWHGQHHTAHITELRKRKGWL
jgi:uncharacterized damage-inducible protein DinB